MSTCIRLDRRKCSPRPTLVLAVLVVALPVVCLLAVGTGQLSATPAEVAETLVGRLGGGADDPVLSTVLWELRLPRVLLGLLVGAVLATTGTALQAVVRNDLADSYLLRVSSGATLGAAVVLTGGEAAIGAFLGATAGAFAGSVGALVLVMVLVGGRGDLSTSRLVLAGLTVSYFLAALTNLAVVISDSRDAARSVLFWMLGSLGHASWIDLPVVALVTVGVVGLLFLWARRLDALGLGDDVASGLGIDPSSVRRRVAVLCALAIGAAVAVSGAVGFVGLVVPHLSRQLVGARHRLLVPCSAPAGAVVLVVADALARTVLAPREIPLGVLTAIVGTPLLMVMMRRRSSSHQP